MGAANSDPGHDAEEGSNREPPSAGHSPAGQDRTGAPGLTYQVILRHLAKFRDGARAVLDMLEPHGAVLSAEAATEETGHAEAEPKSPLQLRIERHMATVDRALEKIRDLNPAHKKKAELPPEIRNQILIKERTLRDIVGAELHFWSAAVENSPLDRFDEVEQQWIRRMIRLAGILGVDAEHEEHLHFLEDWASQEHA